MFSVDIQRFQNVDDFSRFAPGTYPSSYPKEKNKQVNTKNTLENNNVKLQILYTKN